MEPVFKLISSSTKSKIKCHQRCRQFCLFLLYFIYNLNSRLIIPFNLAILEKSSYSFCQRSPTLVRDSGGGAGQESCREQISSDPRMWHGAVGRRDLNQLICHSYNLTRVFFPVVTGPFNFFFQFL